MNYVLPSGKSTVVLLVKTENYPIEYTINKKVSYDKDIDSMQTELLIKDVTRAQQLEKRSWHHNSIKNKWQYCQRKALKIPPGKNKHQNHIWYRKWDSRRDKGRTLARKEDRNQGRPEYLKNCTKIQCHPKTRVSMHASRPEYFLLELAQKKKNPSLEKHSYWILQNQVVIQTQEHIQDTFAHSFAQYTHTFADNT